MKTKTVTYWLKAVVLFIALLGLAFFGGATAYAYIYKPDYNEPIPVYLRQNIIPLWITAILCYVILFFFWKIVTEIGKDNSFSMENVKNFKNMAVCGVLLIAEHIVLLVIWAVNSEVALIPLSYTLLKILAFIIFVILCFAMSRLVQNAYELKQENDLTI
jgi:hypothetical protein